LKYPDERNDVAIDRYKKLAGIDTTLSADELLTNLNVLYAHDVPVINQAGLLFFIKNPAHYISQRAVTCVLYKGNNKVNIIDKKTFDLDIITNIDDVLDFLKKHMNLAYVIKEKRRRADLEVPEVVLREAIVNAVAHRDYFEKEAVVMVEIFDNRVEISNSGGLPKGMSKADFGTRTLARNPLIAS
jgi:ATP-dependent DNA helicase RecG